MKAVAMEVPVREAAERLGRTPSEVRRLLVDGTLRGRHLGHQWVVDDDDLSRIVTHTRRPGRPMAPARAWALLWILDGENPDWLSAVARSQVRSRVPDLVDADAHRWRSLLRARAEVVRCRAHPAALSRLVQRTDAVVRSGAAAAAARGIDLVAIDPVPEVYVARESWAPLSAALHLSPTQGEWNLLVRLPALWAFTGHAGTAVVACDLLDSAEPRAVAAGARVLRDLARERSR